MKLFERIHQDTEIRQIYDAIGQMEDEEAGWAYHNWFHVNNVVAMTEMILKQLAVSEEYLEAAKIAHCSMMWVRYKEKQDMHFVGNNLQKHIFVSKRFVCLIKKKFYLL